VPGDDWPRAPKLEMRRANRKKDFMARILDNVGWMDGKGNHPEVGI
jgi:hypothetical protein